MRGKVKIDLGNTETPRITPACAGKSFMEKAKQIVVEDHPRVCGEKVFWIYHGGAVEGSPPRVRGKANQLFELSVLLGDHPRVCGEKTKKSP